jgi:hypothetical protein
VVAWIPQLGQQPRQLPAEPGGGPRQLLPQLAVERAQHGRDRGERQPVRADLDARPQRRQRAARVGLGEELLDQPGLSHPRLAADQHRLRLAVASPGEALGEGLALRVTADEDRAGDS